MTTLPRILMIDDLFGRSQAGRNSNRREFFFTIGLLDATGDIEVEEVQDPLAAAVVFSGQTEANGVVRNDLEGTLRKIRQGWREPERWALLLLDLQFNTGRIGVDGQVSGSESDLGVDNYFGLVLLRAIADDAELQDLPIVMLSSVDRQRELDLKLSDRSVAEFAVRTELNRHRLSQIIDRNGLIEDDRQEIVGRSLSLLKCLREARRRAAVPGSNITLLGESGSGKELLAKYIHRKSRPNKPFETTHLASAPESTVEDEIFGHVKGAYTGANIAKPGRAELADGGTLFIDEFGLIPLKVQGKLLRLLDRETRETQRIGAVQPKKVDLQIVLATNRFDLEKPGLFQSDLLARIEYSEPIIVPSLRERIDDLPLLTELFLRRAETTYKGAERREVHEDAQKELEKCEFPGNVRSLRTLIESAVRTYPGMKFLRAAHLPLSNWERTGHGEAARVSLISSAEGSLVSAESTAATSLKDSKGALRDLMQRMREVAAEPIPEGEVAAVLPNLEAAYGVLLAAVVKAAFYDTKRRTPDSPDGELNRQGAMGYLLGQTLRHASPRQALNRLLKAIDAAGDELREDEQLRQIRVLAGRDPDH